MANTRKQSTKPTASKPVAAPEVLLICTSKTEKATTEQNAMAVPMVEVSEIVASDSVKAHLCLNLMAGHVAPSILEAHAKRGGLKRLFPGMANAEANALRTCLDAKPAALVAGWNSHVASVKRIRSISLQALAKAIKPAAESDGKVTLRDALTAWCAENDKELNKKAFPQSLVDIFIEFDLLPETDEEGDEA